MLSPTNPLALTCWFCRRVNNTNLAEVALSTQSQQRTADAGVASDEDDGGLGAAAPRDLRNRAAGAGPDALDASRHAAAAALALGEAPGGDGRFRETEFYLNPVRWFIFTAQGQQEDMCDGTVARMQCPYPATPRLVMGMFIVLESSSWLACDLRKR